MEYEDEYEAKYIIFEGNDVVVFTPRLDHRQVAESIGGCVKSAGFVDKEMRARGGSQSLGINSKPEDTKLIQQHLFYRKL